MNTASLPILPPVTPLLHRFRTAALSGLSRIRDGYHLQPESPAPLAWLRIGFGAALLYQAAAMYPHLYALLGRLGIMQPEATMLLVRRELPRIHWLTDWASTTWGWSEGSGLSAFFWFYIGMLVLFTVGCLTRVTAPLVWALHLTLKTTGAASIYGVSEFANILLFYSIFMPVDACWSADSFWNNRAARRTLGAALSRRVLRFQLCLVYMTSGIAKAQGEQWWNGEAIWRATFRSQNPFTMDFLAFVPWIAAAICWGTLFLETGYLLLFWRRTRGWFLIAIVGLHVSIAVCLGLWVFSAVMIAFNLAAWGGSGARPRLPAFFTIRWPGLRRIASS